MITRASGDDCSAQLAHESLHALIAAREPVPIDQILPDTHRVAARDSSSSISSRYASLAPDGRLPACSGNVTSGKKPVITSLAGFELSAGLEPEKPVVTSMAGFAGEPCPQPPGVRSAIPADLK